MPWQGQLVTSCGQGLNTKGKSWQGAKHGPARRIRAEPGRAQHPAGLGPSGWCRHVVEAPHGCGAL